MQVTLPFYASVGLIHWFMRACIPDPDDLDYYEDNSATVLMLKALSFDLFFTVVTPMTVLVFGQALMEPNNPL